MSDASDLSSLSRPALQALAKKYNVRANQRSEEIIEQLQINIELDDSQPSRRLARAASEVMPKADGSSKLLQNSRSATQPLLRHTRGRIASVALPERSSSRRAKAPITDAPIEEDNVQKLSFIQEEEQDSKLSPSKTDVTNDQPVASSSKQGPQPQKAKETQKRLGVGRPKLIGGTGARRSTAKQKLFTPTRGKTVEVVLPVRKVTKTESNLSIAPQTEVELSPISRTSYSPRKQAALEGTINTLKAQLAETNEILALEREKVTTLQARVDGLVTRLTDLEGVAGKVGALEATVEELRGQLAGQPSAHFGEESNLIKEDTVITLQATSDHGEDVAVALTSPVLQDTSLPLEAPDLPDDPPSPPFNLVPSVIGKRLRREASGASLASAGLDSSPKKKARLDNPSTDSNFGEQETVADGNVDRPVVRSKAGSSHKSASIPPTFGANRPSVNKSSRPSPSRLSRLDPSASSSGSRSHQTFRSSSHPAEASNPSSSQPITASANQTENQARAASVGIPNGVGAGPSTRVSLRTLASRESVVAGPSRSGAGRVRERAFEVGRYSTGGSALPPAAAANVNRGESSSNGSRPRHSGSPPNPTAIGGAGYIPDTTTHPFAPDLSDRSKEHHYPDPVTHLEPLTLFDSGKDFMGSPKQKYHSDWHSGIVFDDVFDAETAEVVRRHAEVAADGRVFDASETFGMGMDFDGQIVHPTIIEESDEDVDAHGERELKSPQEVSWEKSLGIQLVHQDEMDTDAL